MCDLIEIICVSYNDPQRKEAMTERFRKLGIDGKFVENLHSHCNFQVSATRNHLSGIKQFLQSSKPYAIIMEDDVFIRKSFKDDMPRILKKFRKLKLDILLLGYITFTDPIKKYPLIHKEHGYTYLDYSKDPRLWGAQAYIITRNFGNKLLEKFSYILDEENPKPPFIPDHTITKTGKRALIYPMLFVETGTCNPYYGDLKNQTLIHQLSKLFNYQEADYL
jgi:GR25 family glycosyltransferase involved in LPS biosynthesis